MKKRRGKEIDVQRGKVGERLEKVGNLNESCSLAARGNFARWGGESCIFDSLCEELGLCHSRKSSDSEVVLNLEDKELKRNPLGKANKKGKQENNKNKKTTKKIKKETNHGIYCAIAGPE